ncbi:Agrin, partial [Stegodyphus mimosarum]
MLFSAVFVLQVWLAFATGQMDETAFGPEYTVEDSLQKENEEDIFQDYIPIQTSREEHFLEGLIVEAGMHVLFPQLYIPKEEDLQSMTLEERKGQPEIPEDYMKSKRKSDCPNDCPLYSPVCGSDGKVYPSECHLRKENCGSQNVSSSGWEICRGKHYLCPFRCLDFSDPVCASDGKIYHNICIMRKLNC